MKLWVCDECDWCTLSYPPYGLCCSVKPHRVSYKMKVIEIDRQHDREVCAAAGVKPEHLDYVFGPAS